MTDPKKPKATVTNRRDEYTCYVKISRLEIEAEKHDGSTHNLKMRVMDQSIPVVAVLGYDPVRHEIVMVNELRAGALLAGNDPYIDNLVTGSIKPNETAIAAGTREMKEETGLELHAAVLITDGIFTSPSGVTEKTSIVFGIVDTSKAGGTHGLVHEKEDLKTVILPADKFIRRAERGCIKDLRSVAAAFWFAAHKDGLRQTPPPAPGTPRPPSPQI